MPVLLRCLSVCMCVVATISHAVAEQKPGSDAAVKFFDSNGVKIAFIDAGVGEPIVFVHGFALNLDVCRGWCDVFGQAGYRTIALDLRGHGQSGTPHEAKVYGAEMADDIVRLLDHLNIRRAHVVGYSLGGAVANKLRERHPDRLITVTLGGVGGDVTKWFEHEFDISKVARSLRSGDGVKVLLREVFGDSLTEAQVQDMNGKILKGQDPLALAAVIDAQAQLNVAKESLKDNRVPTLFVIGELDAQKSSAEEMAAAMNSATLTTFEGRDHMQTPGTPEFLNAILEFIQKNREK